MTEFSGRRGRPGPGILIQETTLPPRVSLRAHSSRHGLDQVTGCPAHWRYTLLSRFAHPRNSMVKGGSTAGLPSADPPGF
jgi:hypothetical protein